MHRNFAPTTTSSRHRINVITASLGVLGAVALAGCGDDGSPAADATATSVAGTTVAPTTTSPPETTARAATGGAVSPQSLLLAGADVGAGWSVLDEKFVFPNDAALASSVPECAVFVDLVFDGGSEHGVGAPAVLGNGMNLAWTYVVVFDTEAEAAAMLDAVSTPDFDQCWAKFNDVAVPLIPIGHFDSASYEPTEPVTLDVDADKLSVKHLEGTVHGEDGDFADTCTCVFAQVGRGVVELHSTDGVFDPARRSEVVQAAVDKVRAALT